MKKTRGGGGGSVLFFSFWIKMKKTTGGYSGLEQLIRSFINYFNCGIAYRSREAFIYRVEKFSDIQKIIIPFFDKYQVQGVKRLDYIDFCKTAELIENKSHLSGSADKRVYLKLKI